MVDSLTTEYARVWILLPLFGWALRPSARWREIVEARFRLRGIASDERFTTLRVENAVDEADAREVLALAETVNGEVPFLAVCQLPVVDWVVVAGCLGRQAEIRIGREATGDLDAWRAWLATWSDHAAVTSLDGLEGESGVRTFLASMGIDFLDELAVGLPRDFFGEAESHVGQGIKVIRGRKYDMSKRYVYGRGRRHQDAKQFLGIWDREAPEEPLRRYPRWRWRRAERVYERLVTNSDERPGRGMA